MVQDRSLQILVVGANQGFHDEFKIAFSGVPDRRAVVHYASTHRQALDVARDRQPHFVVAALEDDARALTTFSKELYELVPGVVIAAAFQTDRLADGQPDSAMIIELLRAEVRDFLRRPLSTTELRDVLDRLLSQSASLGAAPRGKIFSFVSNKGGVGKSTLSVNVACALAERHPGQVLLIDTSLQLGICALMLDLAPTTTIVDAVRERDRLDETLLRRLTLSHRTGVRLLAAPADALEAAEIGDEAVARILNLARRTFQYVVIDTFPLLDNIVIAALDVSDLAFVVLQGTAPSVAGIARLLPVLEGLGVPAARLRLVLNRNYRRFLGNLTPPDIEARLGRPLSFVVPYDKGVLVSMNTGAPHIVRAARWLGFGRVITNMADTLDGFAADTEAGSANRGGRGATADTTVERRSHVERRVRDVGRAEGDRRSGLDRRVPAGDHRLEREVSL
jgi:pilus assembly protein CpaE